MNRPIGDSRKRELAQIHIGKTALGMDDDTYRAMLRTVAGVDSAGALDAAGRRRVLARMHELGWQNDRRKRVAPPSVTATKEALTRKIAAMLAEAGKPWEYADGIARRMFQVERASWCDAAQMRKIVAALSYAAKRRSAGD